VVSEETRERFHAPTNPEGGGESDANEKRRVMFEEKRRRRVGRLLKMSFGKESSDLQRAKGRNRKGRGGDRTGRGSLMPSSRKVARKHRKR